MFKHSIKHFSDLWLMSWPMKYLATYPEINELQIGIFINPFVSDVVVSSPAGKCDKIIL